MLVLVEVVVSAGRAASAGVREHSTTDPPSEWSDESVSEVKHQTVHTSFRSRFHLQAILRRVSTPRFSTDDRTQRISPRKCFSLYSGRRAISDPPTDT